MGMNKARVCQWLSADEPRLQLMVNQDSGPLRPLQQRLLTVYRFHAHKMWKAGKGLLLRSIVRYSSRNVETHAHWQFLSLVP